MIFFLVKHNFNVEHMLSHITIQILLKIKCTHTNTPQQYVRTDNNIVRSLYYFKIPPH